MYQSFSQRLNEAMNARNMKAVTLAEKSGLPKSAISQYLSGLYEPNRKNISKLANALNVSGSWLLGLDVPMYKQTEVTVTEAKLRTIEEYMQENNIESLKLLPLLSKISNSDNWLEENIIGYMPFDSTLGFTEDEDYFYLKVDDNEIEKIVKEDDCALMQLTSSVEDNDIVAIIINNDNAILRKYRKINEQFILLESVSNNTNADSITLDLNTTNFKIVGKLVGYFGKYNK